MNSILYDINTLYKRKETLKLLIDEINKGSQKIECKIDINGNGDAFGDNNISIAIKYKLEESDGFGYFNKMQNKLLAGKMDRLDLPVKPHITIHMIHFNKTHNNTKKFVQTSLCPTLSGNLGKLTPKFETVIINAFNNTLKNQLVLNHTYDFKKMGNFYALMYKANDNKLLTNFRGEIYEYIKQQIGSDLSSVEIGRNNIRILGKKDKFFAYCDGDGNALYAIQDYYHGVENWVPHVSIAREINIKKNNEALFNNLNTTNPNVKQIINNVIEITIPDKIKFTDSKYIENSVICQK